MENVPPIALIDDDPFVLEALDGLLRSIGYSAVTFTSAEEFLEYPAIDAICCLVTDLKLGGQSGLQLLNVLAESRDTLPVIVITAYADERTRRQCIEGGALGFLTKPIHQEQLLALIERAVARPPP